jgi:DNA-binding MarR family transcriptional regulator
MSRERLLLFIAAHPDKVWQKDVAGDEGINASSASEMVSKLVEDGYLIRESDETDKRAVVLKLTEKGAARAEELRAGREAALTELFAKLTDQEKETLANLLDKLLD